jgi:uncharacterized phiE125 gp8 family phage protein
VTAYVPATTPALPVTLADFKAHLKVDPTDTEEDVLREAALAGAVDEVNGRAGRLNRVLLTQEWTLYVDRPERARFLIDLGPVQEVTEVAHLVDGEWTVVPAADYIVQPINARRAVVVKKAGTGGWPRADAIESAWRITYTAGYGDTAADVPPAILSAIRILATDLFENRDATIDAKQVTNPTVDRLLALHRLQSF